MIRSIDKSWLARRFGKLFWFTESRGLLEPTAS
jgi:hypothetical protein